MDVKVKKVFKFALMPGIVPMMRDLASSGFAHIAFFMAMILQSVRLLPARHPYTLTPNIGRFGLRHVLAESGRNLKFDRDHIDQVIVYFSLLVGLVILFMQCCILVFSFMIHPALAAMPSNYGEFFVTDNPLNDIAFIMLDRVFGVEDMFNSCVALNQPCLGSTVSDGPFPFPLHYALHAMFRIYSIALMVIAVLIFCYFIIAIVTETAQDGTPFGRRFNHVWAPIRMVVALGLLVPIGLTGLNSGQYITLYAAKWGSGFATNAWLLFNQVLTGTYLGDQMDLIATPKVPELDRLLQFMLTAQTCRASHLFIYDQQIEPFLVKSQLAAPSSLPYMSTGYQQALDFSNYQTMEVRFGYIDPEAFPLQKGFVNPVCGSFLIPVVDLDEPGAQTLLEFYYNELRNIYDWYEIDGEIIARRNLPKHAVPAQAPVEWMRADDMEYYSQLFREEIEQSVLEQAAAGDFDIPQELLDYGWAGASIWYNRIARMNGAVTTAAFNIPRPKLWPAVLEYVVKEKRQHDADVPSVDRFNRVMADGFTVQFDPAANTAVYDAEYDAYRIFEGEDAGRMNHEQISHTGNVVIDLINYFFGTEGLFNIRQNADIHPLAQLSAVGKGLIESTIRNVGLSIGAGGLMLPFNGNIASIASGLLLTFAMIGLTAGFALFYVIPFLPFLYFFFSVGGWIKGIFEAMVGVPLWALAHIRIDGQGLPGDAAANGYYLIFEIFLRPILMLFGLLGSILLFAALVRVLNDIFDLVIHNLTGFDIENGNNPDWTNLEFYRGAVDEFFFTIIYTIVVYMIGVSSFKMVYLVPNQILRWMGSSVSTFGDQSDDPTAGMMQTVAIGGGSVTSQMAGSARQGGATIREIISPSKGQPGQ